MEIVVIWDRITYPQFERKEWVKVHSEKLTQELLNEIKSKTDKDTIPRGDCNKDYPEEEIKELEEAVKKIWETGKVEW